MTTPFFLHVILAAGQFGTQVMLKFLPIITSNTPSLSSSVAPLTVTVMTSGTPTKYTHHSYVHIIGVGSNFCLGGPNQVIESNDSSGSLKQGSGGCAPRRFFTFQRHKNHSKYMNTYSIASVNQRSGRTTASSMHKL